MPETCPPYLFHPGTVEKRIAALPRTAELIHEKKRMGEQSVAFPALQKTEREILRVLGRAGTYDHLDELLRSLERCLANGWDAHQLGARDRDEFASLMSDLQVAEHCLLRGFTIESPVGLRHRGRKPDLYVRKEGATAIIEVFRPRELPAFQNFGTDVRRILLETDIRLDYRAEFRLECLHDFDREGKLVSPWHPIDLDGALRPIADEALGQVAAQLAALQPTARKLLIQMRPAQNLKLTIELTDVRRSDADEPKRLTSIGQSYGGYEPVGMLARLLEPIVRKAKKRQAGERGEDARILVCDVTHTIVAAHLQDEHRRDGYAEILRRRLQPQVEQNYDVIALCQRQGWSKPLRLDFGVSDDAYQSMVSELFGANRTL